MDIYERINEYIKGELHIYETDTFSEMLAAWPNKEEKNLYRGINFKTKEDFDSFIEGVNSNGAYIQHSAASFTDSFEMAKTFSLTSRSYYLDRETMRDYEDKNTLCEIMSGYRGVILKVTVPENKVVEVKKSGFDIENEYLFAPGQEIKVEITEVKTYYDLINEGDLNIQDEIINAIQESRKNKTYIIANSLINYVIVNNPEYLTENIKNIIVENDISLMMQYKKEDLKYLSNNPYLTVIESDVNTFSRKKEQKKEILFYAPNFTDYIEKGLLTESNERLFKKIAKEALKVAIQVHVEHRDNPNTTFKYSMISHIVPYLSEVDKSLHSRMIRYKVKESYEEINRKMAENFKKSKGISRDDLNFMKDFLQEIIESQGEKSHHPEMKITKRSEDINKAAERRKIKINGI